jgi:hypothetical protein|nr:MAG TPA: hypothetical protein [Caudoviricetes sp.]DAU61727.1 MAG TPA: hypothetical protein [Bacteriophage sp.]
MKYKFDINSGHYIALNEDDNTVQIDNNTDTQNNSV